MTSMVQPVKRKILANPCDEVTVRVATPDECRALGLPLWRNSIIFAVTSPDENKTLHQAENAMVIVKPSRSADDGTKPAADTVPAS